MFSLRNKYEWGLSPSEMKEDMDKYFDWGSCLLLPAFVLSLCNLSNPSKQNSRVHTFVAVQNSSSICLHLEKHSDLHTNYKTRLPAFLTGLALGPRAARTDTDRKAAALLSTESRGRNASAAQWLHAVLQLRGPGARPRNLGAPQQFHICF
ncbi:UNVERIFIED_CONTAM: hypothetical protein K2H54_050255 [Gekko kuhli]